MIRFVVLALALFAAGCSHQELTAAALAPTSTESPAVAANPDPEPTAGHPPAAPTPAPDAPKPPPPVAGALTHARYTLTGPDGMDNACLTRGEVPPFWPMGGFVWELTMHDAGDYGIAGFVLEATHSPRAGCAPPTEQRGIVRIFQGISTYGPHSYSTEPTTYFAWTPSEGYLCGSYAAQITAIDGWAIPMVKLRVDMGVDCVAGAVGPPRQEPEPTGPLPTR